MQLLVAASAVGGALADARPTGLRTADVVLTAAFAGLVAFAGSYARRWAWMVAPAIAMAAAGSNDAAVAFAVGGVVIAFIAIAVNVRSLGLGAATAGLGVQALLRLPDFVAQGVPSLVAGIAVIPLFVSAYRFAPGRVRRRVRKYTLYAGATAVALVALASVAALLARSKVEAGITSAEAGLEGIQNGNRDVAVGKLNASDAAFRDASDILGSWWAAPARVVPVVGQQLDAVKTMADEGASLTGQAATAAAIVDYDKLRVKGGAIDLDIVRKAQGPIAATAHALDVANQHLSDLSVGWLLPPVRDRFDKLSREIAKAAPAAVVARDVMAVAPVLLGSDATQHYLLLFGTPSETRELGGFVGNYAEVTAEKGKLTLTKSGRILELSDPSGKKGWTLAPGDFTQPFTPYRVTRFFGNVSASPNFPDVANVASQLYEQSSGQKVDGVFYIDPYALAGLLELTGPITLKDSGTKLVAKTAARTLLVDQYLDFPNGERVDFLDEATRVTFERITSGDLPKPAKVADVMSPMVDQGHVFGQSTHPEVEQLFRQLALDGSIPSRNDGDYLSVTQSNENPNKIDAYLQRDVTYDATFLPDTGQVDGQLNIRLTNSAPSELLPEDVIGNARGKPPGTNHLFLTVYTPLSVVSSTLDDQPIGVGSLTRFGLSAYSVVVDVPPGGSVTVKLQLSGVVARSRQYQLTVVRQPTVNSDDIRFTLHGRDGWVVKEFPGYDLKNQTGQATVGADRTTVLSATMGGE
jgi:hypothetical protein